MAAIPDEPDGEEEAQVQAEYERCIVAMMGNVQRSGVYRLAAQQTLADMKRGGVRRRVMDMFVVSGLMQEGRRRDHRERTRIRLGVERRAREDVDKVGLESIGGEAECSIVGFSDGSIQARWDVKVYVPGQGRVPIKELTRRMVVYQKTTHYAQGVGNLWWCRLFDRILERLPEEDDEVRVCDVWSKEEIDGLMQTPSE